VLSITDHVLARAGPLNGFSSVTRGECAFGRTHADDDLRVRRTNILRATTAIARLPTAVRLLAFETMILDGPRSGDAVRYATWRDPAEGHPRTDVAAVADADDDSHELSVGHAHGELHGVQALDESLDVSAKVRAREFEASTATANGFATWHDTLLIRERHISLGGETTTMG